MKLGIAVAGPYLYPHTAKTETRIGTAALMYWEYTHDATRANAPTIPCASIIEISAADGVVLAALGRQLIPETEMRGVNMMTWGDLFRRGSTIRFVEDMLTHADHRHRGENSYLERMANLAIMTAFRPRGLLTFTAKELAPYGITPKMNTDVVRNRLRPFLEAQADDPFLHP